MVGRDQSVFTWGDQLLEASVMPAILAGVESSTVLGSGLVRWGVDLTGKAPSSGSTVATYRFVLPGKPSESS